MTLTEKLGRAAAMGCPPQNVFEVNVEDKSECRFGDRFIHKVTITRYVISDIDDFSTATYRHAGAKERERIKADFLFEAMKKQ